MLEFIKKILKEERGNAIILAALSLVGLLGIAGLALDGGNVYMTKSELQKVANASVLSGAQELTGNEQDVNQVVTDILNAHKESASLKNLQINMGDRLSVDLTKTVPLSFASIFGFKSMDVTVHAAAGISPMGRAVGAAPLGINEDIPLEFYKTYQLKVGSSGVDAGNFGILALGGPGASTYEDNLRYGYQEELKIGDIVDTQTGNIAGKTRDVIQDRINGCSEIPGDYNIRNCSRIILVPVYKPYSYSSNQLQSIQITGFAYFYITDPMDQKDTSINGVFIKRAGTGFFENGSSDNGAYCIRLIE